MLCATEKNLEKIKVRVDAAKLTGQDAIGVRVGKVINQYKVAKHFELTIGETTFSFGRKPDSIATEAALDGLSLSPKNGRHEVATCCDTSWRK